MAYKYKFFLFKRKLENWRESLSDIQKCLTLEERKDLLKEKILIENKIKEIKKNFLNQLATKDFDVSLLRKNFKKIKVKDFNSNINKDEKDNTDDKENKSSNDIYDAYDTCDGSNKINKASFQNVQEKNETQERKLEKNDGKCSEFLQLKEIDVVKENKEKTPDEKMTLKPHESKKVRFGEIEFQDKKRNRRRFKRSKTAPMTSLKPILKNKDSSIKINKTKDDWNKDKNSKKNQGNYIIHYQDHFNLGDEEDEEEILKKTIKDIMIKEIDRISSISTVSEFEKFWKSFQKDKETQTLMLKKIGIENLAKIFKKGIDYQILFQIFENLMNSSDKDIKDLEVGFYSQLPNFKNIKMTFMMLTKKEKNLVKDRILGLKEIIPKNKFEIIAKMFKL